MSHPEITGKMSVKSTVPFRVSVPAKKLDGNPKFTKIEIITKQNKFEVVKDVMYKIRIPSSTYYAIYKRLDRQDKYADVRAEIHAICCEHTGRYGN